MMALPARHKSLTLLAGTVIAQLLLLAVQIKREGQVRLIRVWAVELVSPLQRIVVLGSERRRARLGRVRGLAPRAGR